MKKLIVATLLVVGITAFAQEKEGIRPGREKLTAEQKVDFQVKKLTKDLDLNEKQSEQVKALVSKEVEKREAKRAEMDELKKKKREEMKAQRDADQTALRSEMKKILTVDQYAKWEKGREERKEHMKEKMWERRKVKESNVLPDRK